MADLLLATAIFLISHGLAAVRPWRAALVARIGERLYVALFSVVSLGLVVWLGLAYAQAPYVELWPYLPELRWLPVAVMPIACVLIAAGLTSRNPFSLGAGAVGFDASNPGIVAITRHPAIWGLVLWSASHIPINGDAAGLILFGLLSVLGLSGPMSLDAKRRRALGNEAWRQMHAEVRQTPWPAALAQMGLMRPGLGLALYAVLFSLHDMVIGVAPLVF